MKYFPLDCTTECPHYKTWNMSVDNWTSVCDILKVQVDDCDGVYIRYRCPLDSDKLLVAMELEERRISQALRISWWDEPVDAQPLVDYVKSMAGCYQNALQEGR